MKFVIPQDALNIQKEATDPLNSVWVHANAGSGKTHVLTERVIRLLSNGVMPSRILCLTYTNAAAQVMKTRIFARLKEWSFLSDEDLTDELKNLGQKNISFKDLENARCLFARSLETPGGLKIQTIHAFCQSILQNFPLEANLSGHFTLIDENDKKALIEVVKKKVLFCSFSKSHEEDPLSTAVKKIFIELREHKFNQLIEEIFEKRYLLKEFYQEALLDQKDLQKTFIKSLKIENLSFKKLHQDLQKFPEILLKEVELLQEYGKIKAKKVADDILKLQKINSCKCEDILFALKKIFLTKEENLKKVSDFLTKDIRLKDPDFEDRYLQNQNDFSQIWESYKNLLLVDFNTHLHLFSQFLIKTYDDLKRSKSVLDFEDLIYGTLYLLRRSSASLWVQYKLDQRIDHILLDEAQDTDKAQWEIVQILIQEFFSGEGQKETRRTIFAVGDEKQAIYGFRGADPKAFEINREKIKKQYGFSLKDFFKKIALHYSFRSSPTILRAVDKVFAKKENYQALSYDPERTSHQAIKKFPGCVEIWPIFLKISQKDPEDWLEESRQQKEETISMAETIVDHIEFLLKNKKILKSVQRPVRAGDIIILVRERKASFLSTVTRCLKEKNIPIAGADKFLLTDHIAVQDLLALGKFLLLPRDNLSLACLFKSPLFNLKEEDLYFVAIDREKKTLWESLQEKDLQPSSPLFLMRERLKKYRTMINVMPVYDFYAHLLEIDKGRQDFVSRFGLEVQDVLNEFLQECLNYQTESYLGMQGFIENLIKNSTEIKRNFDQEQNEIRILTVHGAKGLEAPIVFLVDFDKRNTINSPLFYNIECENKNILLCAPEKKHHVNKILEEKEQLKINDLYESKRLLYVGMTRAKDYLLVTSTGAEKSTTLKWIDIIQESLEDESIKKTYEYKGLREKEILCYMPDGDIFSDKTDSPALDIIIEKEEIFENESFDFYLNQPLPQEENRPPLMPSQIGKEEQFYIDESLVFQEIGNKSHSFFTKSDRRDAMERGQIFHKILQYLSLESEKNNLALLHNIFEKEDLSPKDRIYFQEKIENLFKNKTFSYYFSQEGENEVSVTSILKIKNKKQKIVGRIDRLVFIEDRICILDYKTGFVPEAIEKISAETQIQMALYRKILEPLYPNKEIEALLLYTAGPIDYLLKSEFLEAVFQNYAQ